MKTMAVALLNFSDDEGYFYGDPSAIRSFARPFDDDSKMTLGCVLQLMKIDYIEIRLHSTRGYIGRVVSFSDHQRVDKPKPSTIKKFFNEATPVINLGSVVDESKTPPAGKEGKGKDSKGTEIKPSARKARGAKKIDPLPQDSKHSRVEAMVMNAWSEQNSGEQCPWDGGEGKQLKALLDATPGWPDTNYAQCLDHMYRSDGFPSGTRPREFLPRLPKYFRKPLDRFKNEAGMNDDNGTSKADKRSADIQRTTSAVFERARAALENPAGSVPKPAIDAGAAALGKHTLPGRGEVLDAGDPRGNDRDDKKPAVVRGGGT